LKVRRGFSDRRQTVFKTFLTPFEDLTRVPLDVRLVLCEPRASQDDVRGGALQYHECDFLGVKTADAERQCGGEMLNVSTAQRFSLYGLNTEILLAALAKYI